MTRFLFLLGETRGGFLALLLAVAVSGCLPSIAPKEAAITGEPSEVDILRADNAELSRRVHELRAERTELKRRLAVFELETSTPEQQAADVQAAGAAKVVPVVQAPGASEITPAASDRPSDQAPSSAQAGAEVSLLLSGSADATDFDLGRAALEAGSFQSADVTLTRFLSKNPRHPFADDALVLRGRARVGSRQFDAAERDFQLVTDRYPEELVAPDAWLELVRLHQTRGEASEARAASQALLTRYPDSSAASLVPQEFQE